MIHFEIKIDTTALKNVFARLEKLNRKGWMTFFLTVISHTLIETKNGLREYAPWKKVSRKQAYGVTFFSVQQQRAFFAKLRDGSISVPYHRTGAQGKAWRFEGVRGNTGTISNRTKGSVFTRGQGKLHNLMGWSTAVENIRANLRTALENGRKALMDYINS